MIENKDELLNAEESVNTSTSDSESTYYSDGSGSGE